MGAATITEGGKPVHSGIGGIGGQAGQGSAAQIAAAAAAATTAADALLARRNAAAGALAALAVRAHCLGEQLRAQTVAASNTIAALVEGADEVVEDLVVQTHRRRTTGQTLEQALMAQQQARVAAVIPGLLAITPLSVASRAAYEFCTRQPLNDGLGPKRSPP